tara:strand:- start:15106 stop:15699 length:594 start_codon:yes stop_codon:yes gene_type:complete
MSGLREIRADYDANSIVVYQAYSDAIADAALAAGRFVAPFSFRRMTWIKPSFLWLMHRSQWGSKKGQEQILKIRIGRSGWDTALKLGVLTSPDGPVFGGSATWQQEFSAAKVHVQWDTERSVRGAALQCLSIQVGLSRHIIEEFVDDWIVTIEDMTKPVAAMRTLLKKGKVSEVKRKLPPERPYPVEHGTARRLWMG